ncbi:MAG: DinB family protein [Dehalococcoidia bacterium]|nr:DinB family protein [Dehalococcoidia bacterium]
MAFRHMPDANSTTFLIWHIARISDNMFHRLIADPIALSLWEREEWHQRFGLQPRDGGTGFAAEQVGALKPDKDLLLTYYQRDFEAVIKGVEALPEQDLDRVPNPQRPETTVGRLVQGTLIAHGYNHLGELRTVKGLQGMPFPR